MSRWTLRRLNAQQIRILAEKHIALYGARLGMQGPYVNREDCQKYLGVWQAVKEKAVEAENWKDRLTEEEKAEIQDACRCGDYDYLLDKKRGD